MKFINQSPSFTFVGLSLATTLYPFYLSFFSAMLSFLVFATFSSFGIALFLVVASISPVLVLEYYQRHDLFHFW